MEDSKSEPMMKFPVLFFALFLTSCSVPLITDSGSSREPEGDAHVTEVYPIPQDHVLGATGCGASCGMQTEQLSHLEDIENGWKE